MTTTYTHAAASVTTASAASTTSSSELLDPLSSRSCSRSIFKTYWDRCQASAVDATDTAVTDTADTSARDTAAVDTADTSATTTITEAPPPPIRSVVIRRREQVPGSSSPKTKNHPLKRRYSLSLLFVCRMVVQRWIQRTRSRCSRSASTLSFLSVKDEMRPSNSRSVSTTCSSNEDLMMMIPRSCLRQGRFSSSSFSEDGKVQHFPSTASTTMTTSTTADVDDDNASLETTTSSSSNAAVTFNEDVHIRIIENSKTKNQNCCRNNNHRNYQDWSEYFAYY